MKKTSRLSALALLSSALLGALPAAWATSDSAIEISPWIGLEPEFDGRFKSGAKKLISGQSPFGVYDPEVEKVKLELLTRIEASNREADEKTLRSMGKLVRVERVPHKYSEPEKGREMVNYKLHFEYGGKNVEPFWMVLASDPATIEIQTKPVTFKEMKATYGKTIERFLYEPARDIGLKPRYNLGSNHFHFGTATAFYDIDAKPVLIKGSGEIADETRKILIPRRERLNVFKDFLVSLFNNPALSAYADDFYSFANAPHPQWNPKTIIAIENALEKLTLENSIQDASRIIQEAYVQSSAIDPAKHNPAKYVFLNLTRTAGSKTNYKDLRLDRIKLPESFESIDEFDSFYERSGLKGMFSQTIEARGIGGQKSFADYLDIISLHVDRLEYLRKLDLEGNGGQIPFLSIGVPRSEAQVAAQILYFVRETYQGLGWSEERIRKRWKRLSGLIRKKSLRQEAEKLDPFRMSLGELAKVAYFDDALNIYRMQCVRLMQKVMNLFPDDKAK
jgi:hypothetical protein